MYGVLTAMLLLGVIGALVSLLRPPTQPYGAHNVAFAIVVAIAMATLVVPILALGHGGG